MTIMDTIRTATLFSQGVSRTVRAAESVVVGAAMATLLTLASIILLCLLVVMAPLGVLATGYVVCVARENSRILPSLPTHRRRRRRNASM
jgi:hypothetical protein